MDELDAVDKHKIQIRKESENEKAVSGLYEKNEEKLLLNLNDYIKTITNGTLKLNKREIKYRLIPRIYSLAHNDKQSEVKEKSFEALRRFIEMQNNDLFVKASIEGKIFDNLIDLLKENIDNNSYTISLLEILIVMTKDDSKELKTEMAKNKKVFQAVLRTLNRNNDIEVKLYCLKLLRFFFNNCQNFEEISSALPALVRYLFYNDKKIVTSSCKSIKFFTYKFQSAKIAVAQASICTFLIEQITPPNEKSLIYAKDKREDIARYIFGIIYQLALSPTNFKLMLIDCKLLETLKLLLTSENLTIRYNGCLIVSYLCRDSKETINIIINHEIINILFNIMENDTFLKTKCAIIFNIITFFGKFSQIRKLIEERNLIAKLCSLLDENNNKLLSIVLVTLSNILVLEHSTKKIHVNPKDEITKFATMIKNSGGIGKLERLLKSTVPEVKLISAGILKCYFNIISPEWIKHPYQAGARELITIPNNECMICLRRTANTRFFPCAHVCLCLVCAEQTPEEILNCPLCRENIQTKKLIMT